MCVRKLPVADLAVVVELKPCVSRVALCFILCGESDLDCDGYEQMYCGISYGFYLACTLGACSVVQTSALPEVGMRQSAVVD